MENAQTEEQTQTTEENTIPFTNNKGSESTSQDVPQKNPAIDFKKAGIALIPLTPVKFGGSDLPLAIGRIALYGGLAYVTYNKSRQLSYLMMGCAGVSALSSFMANQWE